MNSSKESVLFIYKNTDLKDFKNHLKDFKEIIVFDSKSKEFLSSENIHYKLGTEYINESIIEKIRTDTRNWIKKWPQKKFDGKCFNEIFNFYDIPLWYFAENSIYKSVESIIKQYEIIEKILQKESPNQIFILGNSPIFENINDINGLKINYISNSKSEKENFLINNPKLLWFFSRIYDSIKYIIAKTIVKKRFRIRSLDKLVLIYSHNLNWRINFDPLTKHKIKYDSFFYSIMKEFEKEGSDYITVFPLGYLTLNFLNSFISGLKASKGRKKDGLKHIPFEYYWSISIDRKANLERKKFMKIWKNLKYNKQFQSSFKYKRFSLWPLLEKDFTFFFDFTVGHSIKNIEIALNMVNDLKPDLLLSAGGGDFFCEFSLIKAFALKKIASLEIQHGIISYDNPTYLTPKDEFYNIAVYGPYYKKILINNGGYSSSNVFITGQPRYDILSKSKIGKKRICEMLRIDFNKKLVIWTTQTHSLSLDEAVKTKSAIYKTFKSLKNIQLVIKIHPGETDLNFYIDDLFHPILVKEEINAIELTYACDLMITKNSTTALEAIAMNKPVIIFNLGGEPDFVNYVEEGVAIGVYSEEELKHSLVYLLKDDSILVKNRKSFIENYLYRIDGKSTKRVIKLANELIK